MFQCRANPALNGISETVARGETQGDEHGCKEEEHDQEYNRDHCSEDPDSEDGHQEEHQEEVRTHARAFDKPDLVVSPRHCEVSCFRESVMKVYAVVDKRTGKVWSFAYRTAQDAEEAIKEKENADHTNPRQHIIISLRVVRHRFGQQLHD